MMVDDGVVWSASGTGLKSVSGNDDVLVAVIVKDVDRKRKRYSSHGYGSACS